MNGSVSLQQLAKNLFDLAPRDRINVVLERCGHEGPEDDPTSVLALCLDKGVGYAVKELLERENEIAELCRSLDIEIKDYEERDVMVKKIQREFSQEPSKVYSVQGILQFIKRHSSKSNLPDQAMKCFKFIEGLILDYYGIYVYHYLRRHLSESDRNRVENTVNTQSISVKNIAEQIIKYERRIRDGEYGDFVEELRQENGQSSIFEGIEDQKLGFFCEIIDIRNKYLAHHNSYPPRVILEKSNLFFKTVTMLLSELRSYPIMITPRRCGVNKDGFQYVEFLDEDGRTMKFYLYERPHDFRPNQPAYCLHPTRKHPMVNPKIIYRNDLIFKR